MRPQRRRVVGPLGAAARQIAAALVVALASGFAGCGATDVYPLGVQGSRVEPSLVEIQRCALQAGFSAPRIGRGVHVQVAPNAWVYFRRSRDATLEMAVELPGARHADGDKAPGFAEAKAQGDAIWACAEGRLRQGETKR